MRCCSVARGCILVLLLCFARSAHCVFSSTLCAIVCNVPSWTRASTNSPSFFIFKWLWVILIVVIITICVQERWWEVICNAWLFLARGLSSSSESSMDHIVLSGAMTEEVQGCLCLLGLSSCALNQFCSEWSACTPSRKPNCVLALLEEQWRIAFDGICIIHAAFSFNTMPGCLGPYRSGW